jgi:hypothetical protein
MYKYKNYKYANPLWRADAARFIQDRLGTRNRFTNLFKNFKYNIKKKFDNSYKVGWTAKQAVGYKARRAQYVWRKKYFAKHGKVV